MCLENFRYLLLNQCDFKLKPISTKRHAVVRDRLRFHLFARALPWFVVQCRGTFFQFFFFLGGGEGEGLTSDLK